jgi:NADPH2:quinone reductase
MKAIVVREFGAPDVMKIEELPDPAPAAGQLRVRVHAAGVNPVDTYMRAGTYARKPQLPYTPGLDFAGVVDAIGAGVTRFSQGDRVYGHGLATSSGAYAQLTLTDEWSVEPLPDGVSFSQGAALGVPYATAWKALLMRGGAKPGETVLVHGASGGVGTAAVQIARAHGMRVLGTAGSAEGLELARREGAHEVFNHREEGYADKVMAATGGRGVDVVVEMLANANLDRDLDLAARGGRISIVGNRGRVEIDPRTIMGKEATVVGMVLFNATAAELREIHAGLVAGLESGWLKPVIGRELPLADAPAAHTAVMEPGAAGKIVLLTGVL